MNANDFIDDFEEPRREAVLRPVGAALVTGGTGFLGGRVVECLLKAGRKVTVVSRREQPGLEARGVRVVTGSLHEVEVAKEAVKGVSTVFHVAARVGVWGKREDFERDNVEATRVLLAEAKVAGVKRFIYTSTPSVVYNGKDLAGVDERLPLTVACPSPYPVTKAAAERLVLAANEGGFCTVALRPHLIWGPGDPHLVPRVLARAKAGRLRVVGGGKNRVDMVHITNATAAHLAAEQAMWLHRVGQGVVVPGGSDPAGKAYFITNGEPVVLWEWINGLLRGLGEREVTGKVSLRVARWVGAGCEAVWSGLRLKGEPPMTRFVAEELAKDHWFSVEAARRDLNYVPEGTMEALTAELIKSLRVEAEMGGGRG